MEASYSEKVVVPKRIMIFGIPGSGESTFALKISCHAKLSKWLQET